MDERVETLIYEGSGGRTRLDVFLAARLPDLSRSRIQALIREGLVSVNDRPATKAGLELTPGTRVTVHLPPPRPSHLTAETIPLDIIFENADLIVVNKPAGMVVHPAPGHDSGTLVHAILGYAGDLQGIGGEERPGIVHRLDKDTSGLLLIAKTERAQRWLQEQFKERRVMKIYWALVDGAPPTPQGRIEAAIGRHPSQRKQMAILPVGKGRAAVSEYTTLERFPQHTLLEVRPLTGRTHQIRLHLAFLGCPVAGDTVYGRRKPTLPLERHFLHAARLTITLPGETQPRCFEAPLPPDLQQVLDQLRRTTVQF
jgi:23S rRNA pseudouridine1911/1915/1917 synthase